MRVTQDILNEYHHEPPKQSKLYIPIIILFGIFMCFLTLSMFMSIESLTWHGFNGDWVDLLLSVLIPASGLSLLLAKKKIGWFISMVFVSFIAFAAIATIIRMAISYESESFMQSLKLRHIFILTITTTLSMLFQTKSIRNYFKVGTSMWLSGFAISLCLTLALIFLG